MKKESLLNYILSNRQIAFATIFFLEYRADLESY